MADPRHEAAEKYAATVTTHHYCEDPWYSCPLHEEGGANPYRGEGCNCGADEIANLKAAYLELRGLVKALKHSADPFDDEARRQKLFASVED